VSVNVLWTIAPRRPVLPSEERLAAFVVDLYQHAFISGRFTLISSPTAEVSGAGTYMGFPDPPGEWDHLVGGPERPPGTVVEDWFWVPDERLSDLVGHPATVHYDGGDLNAALGALSRAGLGVGDVFLLAWPDRSFEEVTSAVVVPVLAAPTKYRMFEGVWTPYEELVIPEEDEEEPQVEGQLLHTVQWSFGTWAAGGGRHHYFPPLCDLLHRHLGTDLLMATDLA
jgi:hypothetical protein